MSAHQDTAEEITDRLRALLAEELAILPHEVAEHVAALGSIERMQLAVAVEDHFRIRLALEDEARLVSLQDVVSLVQEKLRDGGAAREP